MATARYELAIDLLADLRRIDAQMREAKKRLETAVKASGTTVTAVFGVGPFAATVVGYVGDASRFVDKDHFAAYNGTAPVEVSSGGHKVFRLSRRGNRKLNHAVHMAAVTQVAHRHSEGRAYYDRKVKEGKSRKEALRCLKRRVSDAIFAHLVADARRKVQAGPGGQRGNGSDSSAAGSHPKRQLFGEATPGSVPTIRPKPTPTRRQDPVQAQKKSKKVS